MLCPHHLPEEPFCRGNVAVRVGHELNDVPFFVHGALLILASLPDLNISLMLGVRRADHLQMLTNALVDLRSITLYPTKDS